MPVRFVALTPDPNLDALVRGFKEQARRIAGPQLYLDDPPHSTVYLAAFPDGAELSAALGRILRSEPPPRFRLAGWQAFEGDALTGLNTLVCRIHPEDKPALRVLQCRIVEALAPLRDSRATTGRLAARRAGLTHEQLAAVQSFGFPYVGAGWEPHFTIASFRAEDWPTVRDALSRTQPEGTFTCPELTEYELDGLHPRVVARATFQVH